MTELNELPAVAEADVSDDDLLLLYDNSAATNKARKVTRAHMLKDVAREGGDHDFGTSEITDLTATDASISNLSVVTGLTFDSAATIASVRAASASVVVGSISAGAAATVTMTLTGAATGDHVNLSFAGAIADGLVAQAWVSASDIVSIRLYNADSGGFGGATYTARVAAIRFS
jgi:hypothetical protein